MRDKILVLGSTGNIGKLLVEQLLNHGFRVNAASRSGTSTATGAQAFRFDFSDISTFSPALEDVKSVYVFVPVGHEDAMALMQPFLRHALNQQVKIVFLAGMGIDTYKHSVQRDIEDWLKQESTSFVILRPNWFMDNFHTFWYESIVKEGTITVPAADHQISFIDVRDIADVAACALTSEKWDGQTLVLTGPQALYYKEATNLLSEVIGKPVSVQHIELKTYIDNLIKTGLPQTYAERFGEFYDVAIQGFNEEVTNTVQMVTGHPPRSFKNYVAEHFGGRSDLH